MLNKAGFIFLLFIGIVYAQFNITGTWTMTSSFPTSSSGVCCPLASTASLIGQPSEFGMGIGVKFGTGTGCGSAAGKIVAFIGSGPNIALSGPVNGVDITSNTSNRNYSSWLIGVSAYYPHNNSVILIFQGCEYVFTQSNSKNTATTSYSFSNAYKLSSSWSTIQNSSMPLNQSSWCCLPIDNTLTVTSSNGQVSLGANYGTSNKVCTMLNMSGQVNTSYVSSVGGGFIASPYTVSYISANKSLLLSYGMCMAYYSSMSNILAIGLSLFVSLLVML